MKMTLVRTAVLGMAAVCMSGAVQAQDTTSMDKKFIYDATEGGLAEIQTGQLALQKSQNPEVRMFAKKMIHDHQMLIDNMKPLAMKLGVDAPTGPSMMEKAKYEELKMMSGDSFDKSYIDAMVKDHNADLKDFYTEENKTANPEVKHAVAKAIPVIKEHSNMIDGIAKKRGMDVPPQPAL